eukprot:SAG31_NODE_11541_length_1019_cov_1.109783_2_plen_116_part_01
MASSCLRLRWSHACRHFILPFVFRTVCGEAKTDLFQLYAIYVDDAALTEIPDLYVPPSNADELLAAAAEGRGSALLHATTEPEAELAPGCESVVGTAADVITGEMHIKAVSATGTY